VCEAKGPAGIPIPVALRRQQADPYNFYVMDGQALLLVLQLLFLEGILSIDNAAVLGAMVAILPRHDPIPWPRPLRSLQSPVHRLLGGQRTAALKVGLAGAYAGRAGMLLLANFVANNPWVRLVGGLYLIKIGADHLGWVSAVPDDATAAATPAAGAAARGFWGVVFAMEMADLAFSLDNVVAAIALSRELWVVFIGVGLGIVTMRFAAGFFSAMIEREPILEPAAYLIVLAIGMQLVAEDAGHVHIGPLMKFAISAAIMASAIAYARNAHLRAIGNRLRWLRRVLGVVSFAFALPARPLVWGIHRLRAGPG